MNGASSSTAGQEKSALDYYSLFGIENFAKAKIIHNESGYVLYLLHHPSIHGSSMKKISPRSSAPMLKVSSSYLPLTTKNIRVLFKSLTTSRFKVKDGFAALDSQIDPPLTKDHTLHAYPALPGIPDGIYEFSDGIAYQVFAFGYRKPLPKLHPLTQFDVERTILLFNGGTYFNRHVSDVQDYRIFPARYAFYKDNDLFIMNSMFLSKDEKQLRDFITREKQQQQQDPLHVAFIDTESPIINGKLDKNRILNCGFTIPQGHALALGDNYAVSADSRSFGCVPYNNIEGTPALILWPPSSAGRVLAPNSKGFTYLSLFGYGITAIAIGIAFYISRKNNVLPITFDDDGIDNGVDDGVDNDVDDEINKEKHTTDTNK